MPGRRRTDIFWVERVRSLTENDGLGARRIAAQLEKEGRELGRDDYPVERTVARLQADFRKLPKEQQQDYQAFRWPESLGMGLLPPEASAACLELMDYLSSLPIKAKFLRRPQIRLCRWFWSVTQALPLRPDRDKEESRELIRLANLSANSGGGIAMAPSSEQWHDLGPTEREFRANLLAELKEYWELTLAEQDERERALSNLKASWEQIPEDELPQEMVGLAETEHRYRIAADLAESELLNPRQVHEELLRKIERYIIFKPWLSTLNREIYELRTMEDGRYDPFTHRPWYSFAGNVADLVAVTDLRWGVLPIEAYSEEGLEQEEVQGNADIPES